MGFLAVYLSRTSTCDSFAVQERVKSYSILAGENSESYENLVADTKFGHIIQKYKTSYPLRPILLTDTDGNVLTTLGFLHAPNITDPAKLFVRCGRQTWYRRPRLVSSFKFRPYLRDADDHWRRKKNQTWNPLDHSSRPT